jgi:hypothetical protein
VRLIPAEGGKRRPPKRAGDAGPGAPTSSFCRARGSGRVPGQRLTTHPNL